MKTITTLLSVAIFCIISSSLNAQTVVDFNKLFTETWVNNLRSNQLKYDGIEGSPYLQNEFYEGKIILNDSTIYNGIPLRYNIYENQMEFKHKNGTVLIIDAPEKFNEFNINNQRFIYHTSESSKNSNNTFLEVLENGKIMLAKKYAIELKDPVPAQAYKDPEPAKFSQKPNIYYLIQGDQIEEINNEKKLWEMLDDKQDELISFMKKNKLKVRKEEDLKEIIAFYNSI